MASYIVTVRNTLLLNSNEKEDFKKAMKEWEYKDSYDFREDNQGGQIFSDDDMPSCELCNHHPICEVCLIENKLNGNQLHIGNECVKKFLPREYAQKFTEKIKEVRSKRSFRLKKEDFVKSPELSYFELLNRTITDYKTSRWRKKINNVTKRIETKGAPTKKQLQNLSDWIGDYFNEHLEGAFNQHANLFLEVSASNMRLDYKEKTRKFLADMIKFRRTTEKMTEPQDMAIINI